MTKLKITSVGLFALLACIVLARAEDAANPPTPAVAVSAINKHDLAIQNAWHKRQVAVASAARAAIPQLKAAQRKALTDNNLNEANASRTMLAEYQALAEAPNHPALGVRLYSALAGSTWKNPGEGDNTLRVFRQDGKETIGGSVVGNWCAVTDDVVVLSHGDKLVEFYQFEQGLRKFNGRWGPAESEGSGKQLK
jgi:hypothetical protein